MADGRVHQHLQQGRTVRGVVDEEAKIPLESEVQGEEADPTEPRLCPCGFLDLLGAAQRETSQAPHGDKLLPLMRAPPPAHLG